MTGGSFQDKTILLTGASGLVGRSLAEHFAQRGALLLLTGRDASRLEETARLATAAGASHCECFRADLTDAASLVTLAEDIRRTCPRLDLLIHSGADVTSKPLMASSNDEIDRQIRTNVTGPLQLCRLLVPLMEGGDKVIVNISSLAGYKPNPSQTVYSVSKAGINAISEALQAELGPAGFHVINVALMGIGSGPRQIPVKRFAVRLERAILRREHELFLYRRTKWLMRLYRFLPALTRLR